MTTTVTSLLRRAWILAVLCWAALPMPARAESSSEQRLQRVEVLREALRTETGWVRIHAADAMIEHGYGSEVARTFESEADTTAPPVRIGVWRVMAGSATDAKLRQAYIARVRQAMLDPQASDRIAAAETLGKLNAVAPTDRPAIEQWIATLDDSDVTMPLWLLVLSANNEQRPRDEARLAALLSSADPTARLRAAFAIGRLSAPSPATVATLVERAQSEPADSPARMFILGAAMLHDPASMEKWKTQLVEYLHTGLPSEQLIASTMLSQRGSAADLKLLEPLLNNPEADARIGAADGSLRILRRLPHRMALLDWVVIAVYLLGMLGVGVYYSRANESREEYLLGDRRMKPWAVGLSYFATIFSTITYMSWPGEMVRFGPMLLVQVLAFPLIFVLVGYFVIPYIMRLKVTSAYEILELRLGLSVRMLGSLFFLSMRLFWMAMIIYTTSTQVLVPVAGLDPAYATYVAALMGIVTVIYTSMGGFKAVVFTDVTQTVVLFGGALATVAAITAYFGGLSWVPTHWDPAWPTPILGFDFSARMTLISVILSVIAWQVCTASSDQMAIQRYLSTRDAAAARRMFATAMGSNVLVYFVLTALGLAVLAYFKARPDMLGVGQTIQTHADQLFPQYIVFGVPTGVTGLIIAGLLAAAMSSLSSGLSSCSSVITVDFIERFHLLSKQETERARTARLLSWVIGATVVLLSSVVGMVQGNLLEVTFKVVNLLTAPLAGLFFMAMFVRWATPFGTWVGAIVGIAVIVPILYWNDITGSPGISFMWSMPLCLAAQIGAGLLASLLPVGSPSPMLSTIDPPTEGR